MTRTLTILTFITALLLGSAFAQDTSATQEIAVFAGGCFWCVESDFEKHEGVLDAVSGYMGGTTPNPTYEQVASGKTKYREVVQVTYDPTVISYQELLDIFWRLHDPSDADGSFVDRGYQYTSAIYTTTPEQYELAQNAKQALEASGKFEKGVATVIEPASDFYPAEDYHQDYYIKSSSRYNFYRYASGRDQFIERVWKNDTTSYQ